MKKEYPTLRELKKIKNWKHEDSFHGLAEYVMFLWHFSDWAVYRKWQIDEFGIKYRELRLATAGWSGNENIIEALRKNTMFFLLCWYSSHRGGLHIYHIPK